MGVIKLIENAGSTSKAARVLSVSQPAVSQAIRKLETATTSTLNLEGRLMTALGWASGGEAYK
ncbi:MULTISPECIES: LysR family transcriptional regulator [Pseudomonas]|uniref:LysR family transcriptional regulator n=1 Tax=Pseudomonas TaxID=286 RepID=UPI0009C16F0E|nr:LysR family transcriptional regulator [Pseudomonas psychrotolerans]NMY92691.1 LysR family transcriptional regulator [Pseudomonas psychrotolerans]NRH44946.1 LysR family transcriptional regulator [Pseudomonas sp. MS15a(2019)]OYT76186.1 MAG: hypothetical protein CFE48_27100 [Pseudomonas sp. PGPPP2]